MKVRVVNKTKEGVTFKILGLPKRMGQPRDTATWDEFNANFTQVDGFVYETNEAFNNQIKKKHNIFMNLIHHAMAARVTQQKIDSGLSTDHAGFFRNASAFGHALDEYQKEFGGAPIDFIREYKEFEKHIIEEMMLGGVGLGSVHTKNHKFREDKWSDEEREKVKEANKKVEETFTIGDMLKEKGIKVGE